MTFRKVRKSFRHRKPVDLPRSLRLATLPIEPAPIEPAYPRTVYVDRGFHDFEQPKFVPTQKVVERRLRFKELEA